MSYAHSERGLRKALDEADFYDLDEKDIIIMICLRRAWALRRAPLRRHRSAPGKIGSSGAHEEAQQT